MEQTIQVFLDSAEGFGAEGRVDLEHKDREAFGMNAKGKGKRSVCECVV